MSETNQVQLVLIQNLELANQAQQGKIYYLLPIVCIQLKEMLMSER